MMKLPSRECYNIMQDQRGYIWIGTETGLCRYNGDQIKIYDKQSGLAEGAVYVVREGRKGVITLLSSKNRILQLRNDSLKEMSFSNIFIKNVKRQFEIGYSLVTDKQDNFIINTQLTTYKINPVAMTVGDLAESDLPYKTDAHLIVDARTDQSVLIRNKMPSGLEFVQDDYRFRVFVMTKHGNREIVVSFLKERIFPDFLIKSINHEGFIFLNIHNRLLRIDSSLHCDSYSLPGNILSMNPDKEGGLWLGTYQSGLHYFKDVRKMGNAETALENYSVSGVLLDREGGIWCSTLEKGVFYCDNRYVRYYSNIPQFTKPASLIKSIGELVIISTVPGKIMTIDDKLVLEKDLPVKSLITDVVLLDKKYYFSTKGGVRIMDQSFRLSGSVQTAKGGIDFYASRMDTCNGSIYGLSSGFCFKIENNKSLPIGKNTGHIPKSFLINDDSTALIGTFDGIYKFDLLGREVSKIKGVSDPVTTIIKTSEKRVLMAVRGEGLFEMRGDSAERMVLNLPVQPRIIFDLAEDKYRTLWIATNDGLLKVPDQSKGESVEIYNDANALPANEVNKIAAHQDAIYVSTLEGICRIPLKHRLANPAPPTIHLQSIMVNGKLISAPENILLLSHHHKSLKITLDVLTFKRSGNGILSYRLNGYDTAQKVTAQNILNFENLSPGSYELIAYALNNSGVKSKVPFRLEFVVQKAFWQTGLFVVSCFLLFLTSVFVVAMTLVRRIRRREEEKTRINKLIAESQLSALQARMNPHFIFNAISSIQNYILKQKEEEACDYLVRFSKLIRMVLNNSNAGAIPLREELEMLKLYVQLEQLRFENSFKFICKVSKDVDEHDLFVPVMLIQPYVENAIGHGLTNLEQIQKGVLTLAVTLENGLLKIVVEDNGVGREKSREYKIKNIHRPVAMKLTEQRLEMIGKLKDFKNIKVSVIDLFDPSGDASGTRVEMFLPIIIQG